MHTLDDTALIQQFIKGEGSLTANQNLRIEPAFNCVQLLAKRGGLVATIKRIGNRPTVLLRQQSDYAKRLHQLLLKHRFLPTPIANQPGIEHYQAYDIPAGYEVNYTDARSLWKEWWQNTRQSNPNHIQIELLILARDTWYPVRNIVCSEGSLFVTTLVSEICFHGHERLVWLRKLAARSAHDQATVVPFTASTAPPAAAPSIAVNQKLPPAEPKPLSPREKLEDERFRPDLRQVLRFRQGKLYITTDLGEIVVEGSNLKFWLSEETPTIDPQIPISLN